MEAGSDMQNPALLMEQTKKLALKTLKSKLVLAEFPILSQSWSVTLVCVCVGGCHMISDRTTFRQPQNEKQHTQGSPRTDSPRLDEGWNLGL